MVAFSIYIVSIIATAVLASQKNYSVGGFIFLAVLTGPFALILILLLPESKPSDSPGQITNLSQARAELSRIGSLFDGLQQRINRLEEKIRDLSKDQSVDVEPASQELPKESVPPSLLQEKEKEGGGFEAAFGTYWLNRIGVFIFVLGMGFLLSLTFQFLGAVAKILFGYLIAAGFLIWGNRLEKKDTTKRLGYGILAGGWGLLYLTTYATHYIQATKVIHNPVIAIWLLAGISMAAIIFNLKYQSWIVTALTYLLALMTVGFGDLDYTTVILCALLVGSLSYIGFRMRWYSFLVYGIAASYITFIHWIHPRLLTSFLAAKQTTIPIYQFQIAFGIILVSWTVFNLPLFLLEFDTAEKRRHLVFGNLLNAGFFTVLGLQSLYRVAPHLPNGWDTKFVFLLVLSIIYFLFGYFYKKLKAQRLIVVCCVIAIILLNMALMARFAGISISFFWLSMTMLLLGLGLYYQERVYRLLGYILSFVLAVRLIFVDYFSEKVYEIFSAGVQHNILIFSMAAICYLLLTIIEKKRESREKIPHNELAVFHFYPFLSTLLLTLIIGREANPRWLTVSWTIQGAALLALGFFLSHKKWRICSLCVFVLVILKVFLVDIAALNTIYKIFAFTILGLVLVGASVVYSKWMESRK